MKDATNHTTLKIITQERATEIIQLAQEVTDKPYPHAVENLLHRSEMNYIMTQWHTQKSDLHWLQVLEMISTGELVINEDESLDPYAHGDDHYSCIDALKNHIVYISGPMTGYPNYNYDRFNEIALALEFAGVKNFNPASRGRQEGWVHRDYLRDDISNLCKCSAILKMEGWDKSLGAREEVRIARLLFKMPVYYISNNNVISKSR